MAFSRFLLSIFVGATILAPALALAAPQTIGYDGYVTNSAGSPQSGSHIIRTRIYDAAAGGTLLLDETHPGTSLSNGYFSVAIGTGTHLGGTYTSIAALPFDRQYFLSLEITTLGTGEMSPRTAINAVAYAHTSYGLVAQSAPPTTATPGELYFDTDDNTIYVYDGAAWQGLQAGPPTGVTSFNTRTGAVVATSGDYTTDQVSEGATNRYFTDTRADARVMALFDSLFDTRFNAKTSNDLAEGTSNKYYASSLFAADFATKTTDDLSEGGNNLYYTTARFDARLATKTTDDLTEGAVNQYFSTARARSALSVSGAPLSYDSASGVLGLAEAGATTDGFLSAADWTAFNNKQAATLPTGQIFIGNGSNVPTGQTVSGDLTVTAGGLATLTAQSIDTSNLQDAAITESKLADGAVTTLKIAANTVATNQLINNAITTAKINDLAVTTGKLADLAVTLDKLATDSVDTSKLVNASVDTSKLANVSVSTAKLQAAAVTAAKLADGAVETAKLADLTVTTAKINDLAVTAGKLAADAVTTVKVLDAAITTAKLADLGVTAGKLADLAVVTEKLNDLAVTTAKLANDAVTTSKILNANVTLAKLATDSVDSSKIVNNSIVNDDIADGADIAYSKLNLTDTIAGTDIINNAISGAKISLSGEVANDTMYFDGTDWVRSAALQNNGSNITISGALSLNGGTLSTTNNTAALFNTAATTLNIGGAATTIGFGAANATITGGGALTLRSGNATTLSLDSGTTGALNIGTAFSAKTITIGNGTGATSLSLIAGTGAINIGTNAVSRAINIGTSAAVQTITIGGTAANSVGLGNTQNAGSILIGNSMTTGVINIGGTGAQTGAISIGTGTGAQTLNFGTGGTGSKIINIGTGSVANTVTIGNTTGATALNFNAGTGIQNFTTGIASTGFTFRNTNNTVDADGIGIQLGPNANPNTTNHFIRFIDGDGTLLGQCQGDNAGGVTCPTTSDARRKENVTATAHGLDTLLKIKVRDFNFISAPGKVQQGFIAQELYDIFPQVVSVGGVDAETDPWAVDYGRLTPLLVQSIQDQQVLLGDITPTSDTGIASLISTIQSEVASDPIVIISKKMSAGHKVLTDFVAARISAVRGYFTELFAKKIHADQLCLKKSAGGEVCITGDKLEQLLQAESNRLVPPAAIVDPAAVPATPLTPPLIEPAPLTGESSPEKETDEPAPLELTSQPLEELVVTSTP